MNKDKVKTFADKVYADMAGAMAIGMAYLGVKTGLFRAMAGKGPMSLQDVTQESGLQPRYVEEWLKGMTSAGYLEYDASAQTFSLPDEHSYLLASQGTDHFMGGLFLFAPVLLGVAPKVAEAFVSGGGVRFEEFGPDGVVALDMINRGQYEERFTGYWLKKMPDIVRSLEAGGRVLDVGCGVGRVGIAIAKAFPKCEITGLDSDAESVRRACEVATAAGIQDRMRLLAKTTSDLGNGNKFDLITACDCIHDFSAPDKTLSEIRKLLKPDGALFIVEPKVADRIEDNINPIATMYYGFSIFIQEADVGGRQRESCLLQILIPLPNL